MLFTYQGLQSNPLQKKKNLVTELIWWWRGEGYTMYMGLKGLLEGLQHQRGRSATDLDPVGLS